MAETQLSLHDIQLRCLNVMREFDRVCRENGLTYFLSGGTLLGAVRHKGFIPWDDDADMMMPRADYERLFVLAKAGKINPRYRLHGVSDPDADYSRPWARMTDEHTMLDIETQRFEGDTSAVYIDIFPIDGVPAGDFSAKLFYRRMRLLDALNRSAKRNFTSPRERLKVLKAILHALLQPVGAKRIAIHMNKVAQRYPFATSARRGVSMIAHYGTREVMPAEVFSSAVEVPFAGESFLAPVGYDTYLRGLYGDYMQLPPEGQRVSGHHVHYVQIAPEADK